MSPRSGGGATTTFLRSRHTTRFQSPCHNNMFHLITFQTFTLMMLLRTSKHTLSPSMLTCYLAAGTGYVQEIGREVLGRMCVRMDDHRNRKEASTVLRKLSGAAPSNICFPPAKGSCQKWHKSRILLSLLKTKCSRIHRGINQSIRTKTNHATKTMCRKKFWFGMVGCGMRGEWKCGYDFFF